MGTGRRFHGIKELEIEVGGKKKECNEKNKEKNELKQCPK